MSGSARPVSASAPIFVVLPYLDRPPFEQRRQERIVRERRLVQWCRAAGHEAELFLMSHARTPARLDDEVGSCLAPSDDPEGTDRFDHRSRFVLAEIERRRPAVVIVKGLGYALTPWLLLQARHRFRLVLATAGGCVDVAVPWADYILAETPPQIDRHFAEAMRRGRVGVLPKLAALPVSAGPAPAKRFDIVNVGRFTPNKNQAAILPLADRWRLALVGDGECFAQVQAAAQQRALPVHLPGNLPRAEALALVTASRLMVHPAHHEGVARVVMEALALGVPVVASSTAMPGAFEHGRHGLLVPPDQLLDAARQLLDDPPRLAAMAEAARDHARQHAAEPALAAALEAMLARVLAAPPAFGRHPLDRLRLRSRLAAARGRSGLQRLVRAGGLVGRLRNAWRGPR